MTLLIPFPKPSSSSSACIITMQDIRFSHMFLFLSVSSFQFQCHPPRHLVNSIPLGHFISVVSMWMRCAQYPGFIHPQLVDNFQHLLSGLKLSICCPDLQSAITSATSQAKRTTGRQLGPGMNHTSWEPLKLKFNSTTGWDRPRDPSRKPTGAISANQKSP